MGGRARLEGMYWFPSMDSHWVGGDPLHRAQNTFIQSSITLSFYIYYMLGSVLDAGDSAVIKENKVPGRERNQISKLTKQLKDLVPW